MVLLCPCLYVMIVHVTPILKNSFIAELTRFYIVSLFATANLAIKYVLRYTFKVIHTLNVFGHKREITLTNHIASQERILKMYFC